MNKTNINHYTALSFKPMLPERVGIVRGVVGLNKNCEAGDFILIGFEESQTVTKAFRELGYNAFSCDLKPCTGGKPEWHLQMDIFQAMRLRQWKFIGLHPTCTAMAFSGNRHYAPGKPKHQQRLDAVEWTIGVWNEACEIADFVYMENPIGAMNGDMRLPKPQIVQPYYFGDEFQKTTCLWLKGLKPLLHVSQDNLFETKTHVGKGEFVTFESGKRHPKWYADALKETPEMRKELRSKTFPGIARAMSEQWNFNLLNT